MILMRLWSCRGEVWWGSALVLALTAAACSRATAAAVVNSLPSGQGTEDRSLIRGTARDGESLFVTRVDGNVVEISRAAVRSEREDLILLTGTLGGADQCSILLLSPDGALLARHRAVSETPFPQHPLLARTKDERKRQLQRPLPGSARPIRIGPRRLLAVGTVGMWFPSALEILDASEEGALRPIFVAWNRGTLGYFDVQGETLALVGINNALRLGDDPYYPVGVAVFTLSNALRNNSADAPITAVVPSRSEAGSNCTAYWHLPIRQGNGESQLLPITVQDGLVHVPTYEGVEYVLDPRTTDVQVRADEEFTALHEARRAADPTVPSLSEELTRRRRAVVRLQ